MDSFHRGDLRFDVRDEGPADGPVVVLLHGFPQSAAEWDLVAPRLHAAGCRTLALDQRGYSPGARPSGRAAYRRGELALDVVAMLDAAGVGRAHVVGHDWGAVVGWVLAADHADRVIDLTSVSIPHPAAFVQAMWTSTQGLASWYMALFQLPGVAERLLDPAVPSSRARFVESLVRGGQSRANAERDATTLASPGAFTAALAWYRAALLDGVGRALGPALVPTTLVWSDGDVAVRRRGVELTARQVRAPFRLVTVPGVSHWLPEAAPDVVAAAVLAELRAG